MSRADRLQKMLSLIEERLGSYTVDETVERLRSYGGVGPSIDDYSESLGVIESLADHVLISDMDDMSEAYSVSADHVLSYFITAGGLATNLPLVLEPHSYTATSEAWDMVHIPFDALEGSWAPLSTAFELSASYHMTLNANEHFYVSNSNDKEAQEAA